MKTAESTRGSYCFPLYTYTTPEDTVGTFFATDDATRQPNFSHKFIAAAKRKLGLRFVTHATTGVQDAFAPEDVFHYIYAILHSPTYRGRYAEFLKIDFPRVPLTSHPALFAALAEKGEELAALHLMESSTLDESPVSFPIADSNEVASRHPRYLAPGKPAPESGEGLDQGRVYINQTQYFGGIDPDVWEFEIGGYQVLHKWLKDRKGRHLSYNDVDHYRRVVVALEETMRLMEEVDETIPQWPIE